MSSLITDYIHKNKNSPLKEELMILNNNITTREFSEICNSSNNKNQINETKNNVLVEKNHQVNHNTLNSIEKLFSNINWEIDKKRKLFNSIIIFDWDNTLLNTSIISKYGLYSEMKKYPINDLIQISLIETLIFELFEKSFKKGDTYIITNSEKGWVEYSCKKFYPNFYPLLSKLTIISSRKYKKTHPKNFFMWKIETLDRFIMDYNYDCNLPTNIISIGDSFGDINASKRLKNKFKICFLKTIKFFQFPNIIDLQKELDLLLDKFDYLISNCKNWNIKVEKIIKKTN
jgi:hypothetical protein